MGPKNQIIYSKINDMLVFEHTYVGTWRSLTQPMNKYNNDINVNEIMQHFIGKTKLHKKTYWTKEEIQKTT